MKACMRVKDGLKICILFFQNPEIIFYHFLRIFNLDIFRGYMEYDRCFKDGLEICILFFQNPEIIF